MRQLRLSQAILTATFLLAALPLRAQIVPDLNPVIQNTVDRQAERAQNQAVERAQQQVEAAQNRASETVGNQQVENVQNQVIDQVSNQVERAQAQATERAQAEVERVQSQVERAQSQVERVQGQVEQVQGQLEQVQNQAAERAQQRVDNLQGQASDRAQQASSDVVGTSVERTVRQTNDTASPDTRGVAAATDDGELVVPELPQQLDVLNTNGNVAFVEITVEPGVRAVAYEWVMLVTPAQRAQLDDEAEELMSFLSDEEPFAITDGELLTFTIPPDLDANDAILQLVPEEMRDVIDRNHVYTEQADLGSAHVEDLLPLPMPIACDTPLTVGIIDSAIDMQHPAFAHLVEGKFQQRSFVDATLMQPAAHGTAVASVLVGSNADSGAGAVMRPLLPNATVLSAAVFHASEGDSQGATALRVLNALDWLISEGDVHVINMSLAGPPNRLLAQAIGVARQRGKLIVAAAGNEGPHGPVRYPAAYDGVIGVTAVARDRSVFRWANQGTQVDFAALGVDVTAALDGHSFGPVSGTSIAAPVVSALAACAFSAHDGGTIELAETALGSHATDLGEPGQDPIYGKGLLYP